MSVNSIRKIGGLSLALLTGGVFVGCEQIETVDLVLTNGKIFTVDAENSIANTVVVSHGRIVAVGGDDLKGKYPAIKVVDLGGKTVLPGFVDSHTHIEGNARRYLDLSGLRSIAELKDALRAKVVEMGQGGWITGYGWSEDELAEGRRPLRADLDEAAPDNPVIFARAGDHSAVANSLALSIAGITKDTPDPDGGIIEHDENGELNGVIRERQAIVWRHVPSPGYEELRESLIVNLHDQFRFGITNITDAGKRIDDFRMWMDVYADATGNLPRASVQIYWEGVETMAALRAEVGAGDENFRIGPVKIVVDGGFTGPAAYTIEPYAGQGDYRGHMRMTEEELRAQIEEVHDAGWQLGIHAIGDAAITITANALADAIDRNPREGHRHYLNHFSMRPSDETMERMAAHGIAITQQPNFTYTLEGRYAANLDGWRLQHNNPLRSPMDHGIFVAISSDVLPIGPMVGLYAAVNRKGMSGTVYAADEAITIEEAIRAYTLNGAWLMGEENIKGSIEPGKLADMVVLNEDILSIDSNRIMDVKVDQTWLGGQLVFERK